MKCLHCGNEKFEEKKIRFTPEIKEEQVEVIVPAEVCTHCEQPIMNSAQMNRLRRAAADEYRVRHGLLKSEQIIEFRKSFQMSQSEFAEYLGVGEASIKRWETYFVQEAVQDQHIRLKCDESYADANALQVRWKHQQPDKFNGNVKFNLRRFQSAALYLLPAAKSPLFLNKALFYADFLHFRRHNRGLTGTRYVPLEHGPCPDQFQILFEQMISKGLIAPKESSKHDLEAKVSPDLNQFDDQERETLETIFKLANKDSGQFLFDLSHKEEAYNRTSAYHPISYDYARSLRLK